MKPITKTLFMGKAFHHLESVDSTNSRALGLLNLTASPPEGTVLFADVQTAGRGQLNRFWYSSPKKNLLLSVILYPIFLSGIRHFSLNQSVSLALVDFFSKQLHLDAKIKWPNDIYIRSSKIAGILIQGGLSGSNFRYAVVGIGMNVLETHFPDTVPNATSLLLELGASPTPLELTEPLLIFLERRYLALKSVPKELIKEQYENHLYRIHEKSIFLDKNKEEFEGTIRGIGEGGQLLVELKNGKTRLFTHGEVTLALPL